MAWIKVHTGASKLEYWFNSDKIIHLQKYSLTPHPYNTIITFGAEYNGNVQDEQWKLVVRETPEEIIQQISAALVLAERMTS